MSNVAEQIWAVRSARLGVAALALIGMTLASNSADASIQHRWSFNTDGMAEDSVGNADGTLVNGATVAGGQVSLAGGTAAAGAFVDLPAATIAINTYPEITLEMWETQDTVNQGFSMTAAFGDTWASNGLGRDYLFIATTRGDDVSRGAIVNTADDVTPYLFEVGANGPEYNDDMQHHYALTISSTELKYYIDGVQVGGTQSLGAFTIANLSNTAAYLGKGTYAPDGTVRGMIDEYRLYDMAASAGDIMASYQRGPNGAPIPEPTALVLFVLGSAIVTATRRR